MSAETLNRGPSFDGHEEPQSLSLLQALAERPLPVAQEILPGGLPAAEGFRGSEVLGYGVKGL